MPPDPVYAAVSVVLALGSNIGDRLECLRAAASAIAGQMIVLSASPIFETPPAYVRDQPPFLNAVLLAETDLPPLELLRAMRWLEVELGRRPTFRYGPRAIDIDILFYGDQSIDHPELHIPHPRMAEREFVLRPLAAIAPNLRHPVSGVTVSEMLAALPERTARLTDDALLA